MAAPWRGQAIDAVIAIEARGFIFGPALAQTLGVGFVPVRKPVKLPGRVLSQTYALEYGQDTLELHANALPAGARVLLVDDVLATGGTSDATRALVEQLDACIVGAAVLIEWCETPAPAFRYRLAQRDGRSRERHYQGVTVRRRRDRRARRSAELGHALPQTAGEIMRPAAELERPAVDQVRREDIVGEQQLRGRARAGLDRGADHQTGAEVVAMIHAWAVVSERNVVRAGIHALKIEVGRRAAGTMRTSARLCLPILNSNPTNTSPG